jgi:hypothetical protein
VDVKNVVPTIESERTWKMFIPTMSPFIVRASLFVFKGK